MSSLDAQFHSRLELNDTSIKSWEVSVSKKVGEFGEGFASLFNHPVCEKLRVQKQMDLIS
jgi:hypothetical protein